MFIIFTYMCQYGFDLLFHQQHTIIVFCEQPEKSDARYSCIWKLYVNDSLI